MSITLADLKYSTLAFFLVSGPIAVVRILLRLWRRAFWWDDFWAMISLVSFATFVPSVFVIVDGPSFTQRTRVAGYYMVALFFYSTIWTARLSIMFTVMRITPQRSQKRVMLAGAVVIFLQWVLLVVQLFWVCERGDVSWKQAPFALCPLGLYVAITQVITEIFSDVLLIIAPLWILRIVRLPPAVRFRLVSVLACSLVTTVAALAHAILVVRVPGVWEAIIGALEAGVALAVCNLSVIVPAVARLFGGNAEECEGSDDRTTAIGGTGTFKNARDLNDATLATFKAGRAVSPVAVCVEITVEQGQASWEVKEDVRPGNNEDIYNILPYIN